jgi:tRNA threonylcarbamoyladenosine modification (KEOPS) complex Cgi121 subunit
MRLEVRCYRLPADQDAETLKKKLAARSPSLLVQVTSSDSAATNEALAELLAWQTRWSQSSGSLLAKTPEMDLLLRLTGTSQISAALKRSGARKGEENVLVLAGEPSFFRGISRIGLRASQRLKRSELTPEELMLVERAALLNSQRA